MRKWLAFHRRRRELQGDLDRLNAEHSKAIRALKSPTYEEKAELFAEFRSEADFIEDELMLLVSSYWMSVANRLLIPIPEFQEDGGAWEESRTSGRYYLTKQALSELRTAIRREQKNRQEVWLPWLAALTGLVGALTGLAAVIFSYAP